MIEHDDLIRLLAVCEHVDDERSGNRRERGDETVVARAWSVVLRELGEFDEPQQRELDERRAQLEREVRHDCFDHAVEITTDGPLGHGWECGECGAFLQG